MIPQPSTNGHVEKHAWEFREQFIPPRLFFLLRDQKITASDLLILMVVNALVKADGLGCFAKNEYIAAATNLHAVYTSSRITYLKDLNLLIVVKHKGRRYLETAWSRTADELKELEGKYGRLLRREYRRIIKIETEGKGKPLGQGKGKPLGDLKENLYHKDIDKTKDNEKEKKPATPVVTLFESPSIDKAKKKHRGRPVNPLCLDWAKRLKDACEIVKDCRLKDVDPILWSFQFDQVLEKYKGNVNRIETAVFGYLQAARTGKVDGQSWPTINCPEHFGNTLTWIENKINETGPNGKVTNRLKQEFFKAHGV